MLTNDLCSRLPIVPFSQETLAQKGVQGLLDPVFGNIAASTDVELPLESTKPQLEHEQRAAGWVGFEGWSNEEGGPLGPIGGEFDKGLRGEEEGWRGDDGEITADGCEEL